MTALIFYDTETTGTHIEKDRIVEIAAFHGVTKESFVTYVNPQVTIPEEASKIHGITDAMVASAPAFPEAFAQFHAFCGDEAILVAHNNDNFDFPLLGKECQRHHLTLTPWRTIDSLKWAQKYRPDLPKHNLQYLRQVYGFAENRAHRALDDVMILYHVFSALTGDLSPEQIFTLTQEKPHPKVFKMPFGKYKGKALTEIPASYIQWLEKQDSLDKDLLAAIHSMKQTT